MAENDVTYITVGRIGAPYGVRGWVKVQSFTESVENLLNFEPWYFRQRCLDNGSAVNAGSGMNWIEAPLVETKIHGKGIIARFEGCDDRDTAVLMGGMEIGIRRDQLPEPEEGEYYWADLQGLEVKTLDDVSLGRVDHLMETGANDVMVVKGQRERLIPYVLGHIVHDVDIDGGVIRVDWDPEFD